jgi:hypothetical protein
MKMILCRRHLPDDMLNIKGAWKAETPDDDDEKERCGREWDLI